MTSYPVLFNVARPEKLDRVQLALRILVLVVLSVFGLTMGALFGLVYLALPVAVAIALRGEGRSRFVTEGTPRFSRGIRAVMGAFAYVALLTDRLPDGEIDDGVHFEIEPGAWPAPDGPSVGTALLRWLSSLPSAIVLCLLTIPAGIIWLVAAVMVLVTESYPVGLYDFQCGVLRWQARLLAYHACLVEAYPPFEIDTGSALHAGGEPLAH